MIIPAINAKGTFIFSEPFNSLIKPSQEFTVVSVRSLLELEESGESPYDTIYKAVGMTEAQFKDDLNSEVPIIVFTTDGGEYFYVPASKILSEPITTNIAYREKTIAINLGQLPLDFNLDTIKSLIHDAVFDSIGVSPFIKVIPTSAITVVEPEKHNTFMALIKNKQTIDRSYKTKYFEVLNTLDKQKTLIDKFEIMVNNNVCSTE